MASRKPHCTVHRNRLKPAALLVPALLGLTAAAQVASGPAPAALREELLRRLRTGSAEAAVRAAQQALRENPRDPGIQYEYITLHLALARNWLAARQYDAALTALEAVLALEPQHEQALLLRAEIEAARARADRADELDQLLRLELFEAALDRLRELKALRPDLAKTLSAREPEAWLGAADEHYLARNFNEALALYENVLAKKPDAPADVHSRWALSLALALAEEDSSSPMDPNAAGRLLARATDVLRQTREPLAGLVIGAQLAERAEQWLDAGRTYAEALGLPWELPPADRRRERVAELRRQAVERVRELYRTTPTGRREGLWTIALPDVWKPKQTAHFDVYARNDLIAARVAEALEFHYPRLVAWLGVAARDTWEPRLEVRVHATQQELHQATGTRGITYAVSRTRLQGEHVVLRRLEVFQVDPWLLSATLPHELTHALLADVYRVRGPPLAIDEGLALQAEPPARRLMYRRLLNGRPPRPTELLHARQAPADPQQFYAECDALTSLLLDRPVRRLATTQPAPIPAMIAAFGAGVGPEWWSAFGWESEVQMEQGWEKWFAARGRPARLPLMILVEPAREDGTDLKRDRRKTDMP